ncbi:hypothetical protein [Pseudomonas huanghezhanensis]|uniref:hypothetical protein n=1 Tax=Pseudomonas huanghezhanensis TaxID=3002903 RepID=UPI0022858026|nr:hypothetical protein [Pseudomonas sp. BSw22131]
MANVHGSGTQYSVFLNYKAVKLCCTELSPLFQSLDSLHQEFTMFRLPDIATALGLAGSLALISLPAAALDFACRRSTDPYSSPNKSANGWMAVRDRSCR